MNEEETRHVREGLAEEELAIFDLLVEPGPSLSEAERAVVKRVTANVLQRVSEELVSLDWQLREQAKAAVRATIKEALDELPEAYDDSLWNRKVDRTFDWIVQSAKAPSN